MSKNERATLASRVLSRGFEGVHRTRDLDLDQASLLPRKTPFILSTVRISVNYSTVLQHCLGAEEDVSRLVVVTAPDDCRTVELAAARGFSVCYPENLQAGSVGFNAAHNKSEWINAGIQTVRIALEKEGLGPERPDDRWLLVMDGDVLLPADFHERLGNLLPLLDRHYIYGARGRRIAKTLTEFNALQALQPWDVGLDRHDIVIGYFNLFHLDSPRAWYLKSRPEGIQHDDANFYLRFGKRRSAILPMACLHLGAISVNWGGRVEDLNAMQHRKPGDSKTDRQSPNEGTPPTNRPKRDGNVLLIGLWQPEPVRALSERHEHVILVDTRGVFQPAANALDAADNEWVAQRLLRGVEHLDNVSFVVDGRSLALPAGIKTVAEEDLGRVHKIVIAVEPTLHFIETDLKKWMKHLTMDGLLSGGFYGWTAFPRTTALIELLLGTPTERREDGSWQLPGRKCRLSGKAGQPYALSPVEVGNRIGKAPSPVDAPFGIALFVLDNSESNSAIVALRTLRRIWTGPLAVVACQCTSTALRVACARENAAWIQRAEDANANNRAARFVKPSPAFPHALEWAGATALSPYQQTIWVTSDAPIPEPTTWFSALGNGDFVSSTSGSLSKLHGVPSIIAFRKGGADYQHGLASLPESEADPTPAQQAQSLARFLTAAKTCAAGGPDTACLADNLAKEGFLRESPVHVWFPPDVTVVTAVTEADFPAVAANWNVIRWPKDLPKLVVAKVSETYQFTHRRLFEDHCRSFKSATAQSGVADEQCVQIPRLRPRTTVVSPTLPEGTEIILPVPHSSAVEREQPDWVVALIEGARYAQSRRLLYLDPCLSARPGAEVFFGDRNATLCSGGWAFARRGKRVIRHPKLGPPASMVDRNWFLDCLSHFAAQRRERSLELFCYKRATAQKKHYLVEDVLTGGWA